MAWTPSQAENAMLMSGVRNRIDAFVSWGSDYFTKSRGPQVLDRSDAARIDWGDDLEPEAAAPSTADSEPVAPAGSRV